ncbi:N-6 DNA methylase [bacterium]|nr:N-6 DNA methylase [bacterium]
MQFVSWIVTWITTILDQNGSLPFTRADVEVKPPRSQKRCDFVLYDKEGAACLTGEVKLPWQKDGQSPHIQTLVDDARKKAKLLKAPFFFTWNVNELLLWETNPPEDHPAASCYRDWQVTSVSKPQHLDFTDKEQQIRSWLRKFLYEFRDVLVGEERIKAKPLDVRFIEAIESGLHIITLETLEALRKLHKDKATRKPLNNWMRSELGWTVSDDPEDIHEQLERAAKYACYVFANKLVFYETLYKRFGGRGKRMTALKVPSVANDNESFRQHMNKMFSNAVVASGDYETVFGEDPLAYGDTVPFRSEKAAERWGVLIDQLNAFDFTSLDFDVIGNLFEKLLTPEERSKYGQYFTRTEVVDLINSFCMRTGAEKVMDPACGGGTFLVRAYTRKKELNPGQAHGGRLSDLFGVDVQHFPAHLSTINLSVRELVDEDNYPQVERKDFFDVLPQGVFTKLPRHITVEGRRHTEHVDIDMPLLDAVVTNPPYIRQEEIGKETKKRYLEQAKSHGANLSGRSDIHVYFWPHAAAFLKEHGWLGMITSSQWLDVEYGFKLQEWMLKNFRIVAIFESSGEPWFEGARVATAVTILQREPEAAKRMGNVVSFVQLRRPLREVMGYGGNIVDSLNAVNGFRDEIEALTTDTDNARFRARLIEQSKLWHDGVHLGRIMGKAGKSKPGVGDEQEQAGEYFGGKWGMYVRAPELWFNLLKEHGDRLAPLGDLAEVRFGVKSGKDVFFFPIDCSKDCLDKYPDVRDFKQAYGVSRKEIENGTVKLVRCGEGRGLVKPIEAKYLEPEVHSLMEIDGFVVNPEKCTRMVLLIPTAAREKLGKYVRAYIEWGESERIHESSTCKSRETETKEWYDLTGHRRGSLFWPMGQQYKHSIPLNSNSLVANHNLFDIHCAEKQGDLYAGILNSSWVVLGKFQYGRPVGVEGNLKTEVIDVKMMLVPDPRKAADAQRKRVAAAFEKMKGRKAMQFLSERRMRQMAYKQQGREVDLEKLSDKCELDMPDRRELDDAVLEMIGVADATRRATLIDELYAHLRAFFEEARRKEELAIANKKRAKRRGQPSLAEVAADVYKEIRDDHPTLLKLYEPDFLLPVTEEVITLEIPAGTDSYGPYEILNGYRVEFRKGKRSISLVEVPHEAQAELLALLANAGASGLVWVPDEAEHAASVLKTFGQHLTWKTSRLDELVAERTDDEDRHAKILASLKSILASNGELI